MYDWQEGAEKYIKALSSSDPTPGGGSAAAVCGAIGAALALMAINTTLKLKKTPEENKAVLSAAAEELEKLQKKFNKLSVSDAEKYQSYIDLKKAKKSEEELNKAVIEAAQVCVDCSKVCLSAIDALVSVQGKISKIIISDALCAAHIFRAALKCCVENMLINRDWIKDEAMLSILETSILSAAQKLGSSNDNNR